MRDLQPGDASPLLALLATDEVARFISPPPTTVAGFERFIAWAQRQRAAGPHISLAVVPRGSNTPVGLFQIRALGPGLETSEWGFALGSSFWGSGMFVEAANLVLEFAFEVLGVRRLEARAAVKNGRGNGALQKVGAVQEAVLRRSFLKNGEHLDQALWTILRDEWQKAEIIPARPLVH